MDHANVIAGTLCRTTKNAVLKLQEKNSVGDIWVQPDGRMLAASPIKPLTGNPYEAGRICGLFNSEWTEFGFLRAEDVIELKEFGVDEALPSLKSSVIWVSGPTGLRHYDFDTDKLIKGLGRYPADIICLREPHPLL